MRTLATLEVEATTEGSQRALQAPAALPYCTHVCTGFYGKAKDIDLVESEKVLRAALDSGSTLLNTADFYTGFEPGAEVSQNIRFIGERLWKFLRLLYVVPGMTCLAIKAYLRLQRDAEGKQNNNMADAKLQVTTAEYVSVLTMGATSFLLIYAQCCIQTFHLQPCRKCHEKLP